MEIKAKITETFTLQSLKCGSTFRYNKVGDIYMKIREEWADLKESHRCLVVLLGDGTVYQQSGADMFKQVFIVDGYFQEV